MSIKPPSRLILDQPRCLLPLSRIHRARSGVEPNSCRVRVKVEDELRDGQVVWDAGHVEGLASYEIHRWLLIRLVVVWRWSDEMVWYGMVWYDGGGKNESKERSQQERSQLDKQASECNALDVFQTLTVPVLSMSRLNATTAASIPHPVPVPVCSSPPPTHPFPSRMSPDLGKSAK